MSYAILVIDEQGGENYVCDGMGSSPTKYSTHKAAKETKDFLSMGIEDEVQSINIVPYPKKAGSR